MMTRRRFVEIASCALASAAVGAFVWEDRVSRTIRRLDARLLALVESPQQQLRGHFSYLTLDPAGIAQYFADYRTYRGGLPRFAPLSSQVCTRYLMSTDFFRHGADESRLVRYVGFYDPDNVPCNNPLAEVDDKT
jgi:hypothetical protein